MKKRKICVTTGSRAEYGLLKPVLTAISKNKKLNLFLIVSGMHLSKKHGFSINEIKKDGFPIYATVNMLPKSNQAFSMAQALGVGILGFSRIFKQLEPDINVILGDRDEALASALAASHMNIPNAHIHGGEKSKAGIDEYNRHAITKLSNIHFTATKKSESRILKLGENPKYVLFTGSPGIDDVLNGQISTKKELEDKYNILLTGNEILLLQHPVTTQIDKSEKQIINTLKAIIKTKRNIIAIAPNSDAGNFPIFKQLRKFSSKYDSMTLIPNVPRKDYLGFLKSCAMLVGNSSSGVIEGSYFDIPIINIGIRQQDRERGENVIDVPDNSTHSIYNAIIRALKYNKKMKFKNKFLYGNGKASQKIVKFLESVKINDELIQKQITF